MFGHFLFPILNRISLNRMEFPLKGMKRVALRPSIIEGETLYALSLVKTLSAEFDLAVFLPEDRDSLYFDGFNVNLIEYPKELSLLDVYRLKQQLSGEDFDLFIDLNRDYIDEFSFVLNASITASIFDRKSVNLVAHSSSNRITDNYQYLMRLLGLAITWDRETINMKEWTPRDSNTGVTSDIGVYPGLIKVDRSEDLYEISSLITKRNDISTISYFLGIPQVLLLEENDPFQPPSNIKVIRFRETITAEILDRCLHS
ncbi:hypothetical protein KAW18_12375 [candidate division WOR-3 bacterium]|nr:hypothetical protein [candidate division WOR-3 bacterium]